MLRLIPRLFCLSLTLAVAWLPAHSRGQNACIDQARGRYEELYCQVKTGGEGAALPSLADFRRNPPKTQALLLRRPAARLGLDVPAVPSSPPVATPSAEPRPEEKSSTRQNEASASQNLAGCKFEREVIRCGSQLFKLTTNRPNRVLQPHALTEANRLMLPAYSGPTRDEQALRNYLVDGYQLYIEKMLEIGLGASTMSFSKFYYTYQEVVGQQADFPQRMEMMFRFLQQDKAAMAVQPQYTNELPDSLEQCGQLSNSLIVCDKGEWNWVYESRIGRP